MFDLLEFFFDEVVEVVGDLIGSAAEAISDAFSDSAADAAGGAADAAGGAVDAAGGAADAGSFDAAPVDAGSFESPPVDPAPGDAGSGGVDSFLAGTDGGISADRFDPKPVMGPWAP